MSTQKTMRILNDQMALWFVECLMIKGYGLEDVQSSWSRCMRAQHWPWTCTPSSQPNQIAASVAKLDSCIEHLAP